MLSVVIPTENDEERLAMTLAALVPAAADGTVREVVVVDAGSVDLTGRVADAAGCVFLAERGSLGRRLHRGAEAARRGEWLLFLSPGVVPDARWEVEVATFIERAVRSGRADRTAAIFRYALDDVSAGARLREALTGVTGALTGLPRRSQGLLIARSFYARLGGYRDLAALDDVDLVRRIGRGRLVRLRSAAAVLADTVESPGRSGPVAAIRRSLSRGLAALSVPARLLVRLHG